MDMPTEWMDLLTLQKGIGSAVAGAFPERVWVRAEIAGLKVNAAGHCYLELAQSEKGRTVAQAKAVIWKSRYPYISQYFASVSGVALGTGMEVLVRIQVSWHEVYGPTFVIDEIDPDFTVGGRERKKKETLERLEKEGLLNRQKQLRLKDLPYRLAVISAEGAAGYGDFRRHLLENDYGYAYEADLYPAAMQGEAAAASIARALEEAGDKGYDAILILRGGGSELDLACFDEYELAAAIARCPCPVFTAIGHDRDVHVADQVANTAVKTPTALADLFLDCTAAEDQRITAWESRLAIAFRNRFSQLELQLQARQNLVLTAAAGRIQTASSRLDLLEAKIAATDPRGVLQRGFSLVLDVQGVRIRNVEKRKAGDRIRVLLPDGSLDCRVEGVRPGPDNNKTYTA